MDAEAAVDADGRVPGSLLKEVDGTQTKDSCRRAVAGQPESVPAMPPCAEFLAKLFFAGDEVGENELSAIRYHAFCPVDIVLRHFLELAWRRLLSRFVCSAGEVDRGACDEWYSVNAVHSLYRHDDKEESSNAHMVQDVAEVGIRDMPQYEISEQVVCSGRRGRSCRLSARTEHSCPPYSTSYLGIGAGSDAIRNGRLIMGGRRGRAVVFSAHR